MSLEINAFNHACQTIRRQFQEEINSFNPFFLIYKNGQFTKTLKASRQTIYDLSGGHEIFPHLEMLNKESFDESMFVCLGQQEKKYFLPPFKRTKTSGLFTLNRDKFETLDDLKRHVYHTLWYGIQTIDAHKENDNQGFLQIGNVIKPPMNDIHMARCSMLGDVFSGVILQLNGVPRAIRDLWMMRARMSLKANIGYTPEIHAFPLVAEATLTVFKEFSEPVSLKSPAMVQAKNMAEEVGLTYDDEAIERWYAFAGKAQDMAWRGHSENHILSAAIYTCEDPHIRSIAYLVSEALDISPRPVPANLSDRFDNSFTLDSVNARAHMKECKTTFERCFAEYSRSGDENAFLHEIRAQNKRLLKGKVFAWCASGLLQALRKIKKQKDRTNKNWIEDIENGFQNHITKISWDNLIKIKRAIISSRREGKVITPSYFKTISSDPKLLQAILWAITHVPHEQEK